MSYLQKNRERRNGFFKIIFAILAAVIFLSVISPNFGSAFFRKIFYPFWAVKESIFRSSVPEAAVRTKRSLVAENRNLSDSLAEVRLKLLSYETLEEENVRMREAMNALSSRKALWADVLARPPISLYDTFIINVGNTKVSVGQKVLAYGLIPIGEVVEAEEKTALVRLYSAPGNSFQVTLGGSEIVSVEGVGGGNFQVRVPKALAVSAGEKIYFQGGREILGTVGAIDEKDSDSFKTIYIQSPVNIYRIKAVQVLI